LSGTVFSSQRDAAMQRADATRCHEGWAGLRLAPARPHTVAYYQRLEGCQGRVTTTHLTKTALSCLGSECGEGTSDFGMVWLQQPGEGYGSLGRSAYWVEVTCAAQTGRTVHRWRSGSWTRRARPPSEAEGILELRGELGVLRAEPQNTGLLLDPPLAERKEQIVPGLEGPSDTALPAEVS